MCKTNCSKQNIANSMHRHLSFKQELWPYSKKIGINHFLASDPTMGLVIIEHSTKRNVKTCSKVGVPIWRSLYLAPTIYRTAKHIKTVSENGVKIA